MNALFGRRLAPALLALLFVLPLAAAAQDYPSKPVRVVVPYPPGGGADTVSRLLFARLSEDVGQQFVIDNRGGAGGTIGAGVAATAAADGYTVLYDATAFSVNPFLYTKLPYDPKKDFVPVFLAARVPNLLVVNNAVPERTVAEIIATAKRTPGGLDWASSGNGTVQHLSLELLRFTAGIPLNHVPYRGGGPALNDLMAGQVKYFFSNASSSTGHVKSGSIRAVAHTGAGRINAFPDLPAVADTLSGFETYEWNGVFVKTGTPAAVVERLGAGLNAVIAKPDVKARLESLNVEVRPNTPADFARFVEAEMEKWEKVVMQAGVKLE